MKKVVDHLEKELVRKIILITNSRHFDVYREDADFKMLLAKGKIIIKPTSETSKY